MEWNDKALSNVGLAVPLSGAERLDRARPITPGLRPAPATAAGMRFDNARCAAERTRVDYLAGSAVWRMAPVPSGRVRRRVDLPMG